MKRAFETTAFTGLACLILIGLFGLFPKTGAQSSGAGGEELISLQAAAATVVEMVETWERPPLTPQNVEIETLTPTEATPPPSLQIELSQAPRAEIRLAVTQPLAEDLPDLENLSAQPQPPKFQPQQLAQLTQPRQTQSPRLPSVTPSQPAPVQPLMPPPELDRTSENDPVVDTMTAAPPPEPKAQPKPAPRPKPQKQPETGLQAEQASARRAAQSAAGTGGGSQAGAAGASQTSSASAGQKAKLKTIWGSKIRARIERRKRYPKGANGNASVVVRLTIARDGTLLSYKIAKSSGIATFDQAAIRAVTRAGRFPAAPKKLADQKITVNLPINFSR